MGRGFDIDDIAGLSEQEAEKILQTEGANELPSQKKQNVFSMFFKVLAEPMLLLLLGCGALYLFMGEPKDALMLLSFVFVVVGITFYQERKTEKTLEALRNLASPRALVIRGGERKRIAGRDVVRGDIIIVHEGDRIPADAVLLNCENLTVDESLLTGESIPVRKTRWDGKAEQARPGGDDLAYIYSGSLVVGGRGTARVILTGANTEIGKIGKSLETIKDEDTLLHKETDKIVRTVAVASISLCTLVAVMYAIFRGNTMEGILAGLTLSMAMLPEEFPVVLLIFMTMGAWRISKSKVLTRRPAAIETLGAATVLCADKTGTLTLNKMQLTSLYCENSFWNEKRKNFESLPKKFHKILEYGILASQKDGFDPLEKELIKLGNTYLENAGNLYDNRILIREYPLSKDLLALSHVWKLNDGKGVVAACKGAPEAVLGLCQANATDRKNILAKVKQMSDKGLRVLGVAKADFSKNDLPENQSDFPFEFIGLLGFVDPVRDTAAEAVTEAYTAGMRVIMITGDYPGTAQFIARQAGIKNPEIFITGEELSHMDHQILRKKICTCNIFARVVPEQKLLIVNALKANGEIVAMTGDGVNDAPALKAAHIGIAMGERGTDVARESAALVLLNDDFSSIVTAVRLGRRIFENLRRAMGYILAVHVPIAGMSLLPLVFELPPVLFPAHVAFLELIIDPACSTVFESEKEDSGIMRRPPRDLHQPMLNMKTIFINLLQGLGVLVTVFVLFLLAVKSGRDETDARTLAFTALVLSNVMLIVVNLSWKENAVRIIATANKTFITVVVAALGCLAITVYTPLLSGLFRLSPLKIQDVLLVGGAAILSLAWFEGIKLVHKGGI